MLWGYVQFNVIKIIYILFFLLFLPKRTKAGFSDYVNCLETAIIQKEKKNRKWKWKKSKTRRWKKKSENKSESGSGCDVKVRWGDFFGENKNSEVSLERRNFMRKNVLLECEKELEEFLLKILMKPSMEFHKKIQKKITN